MSLGISLDIGNLLQAIVVIYALIKAGTSPTASNIANALKELSRRSQDPDELGDSSPNDSYEMSDLSGQSDLSDDSDDIVTIYGDESI